MRLTPLSAVLVRRFSLAAPASAAVPHTVQPGETLWSIAAANNLTTRTVAAFNGLSEDAQVVLGSTIRCRPTVEGYAALQQAGLVRRARRPPRRAAAAAAAAPPRPLRRRWAATPSAPATRCPASPRPSRRARRARWPPMNGLDPDRRAARRHRAQAADRRARARARRPSPRPRQTSCPRPRPSRRRRASAPATSSPSPPQHGVSPSLAAAIAWQESGFNNGMVSARQRARRHAGDARHVGLRPAEPRRRARSTRTRRPTTSPPACSTSSSLLRPDRRRRERRDRRLLPGPRLASASRGMFDDTQQYVANVQALRSRFGG